ncbi:MAG TPA: hypothetical protein DCE42_19175 [Myxococcales bacterium]|nr:hypothetical protein [Deltaproteobacteria bacterium]MBU54254.1 hypothetical protein [Deltaproteobacteria bacterium]HAA56897.1 hypothetical protein [Myxococcales bacterium]|tara:strand:- start:15565 stop:16443 length:879 start_codon:yes stop_codon:yes gene_type:complete
MYFEVHIPEQSQPLIVEANNWFLALQQATQTLGQTIDMSHLNFTLLEDGESAEVIETHTSKTYRILCTAQAPTQAEIFDGGHSETAVDLDFSQLRLSLTPRPKEGSFSLDGQYAPGATEDMLTNVFMKMSNLQEYFGSSTRAALQYVLTILSESIKADGAAVLLTDPNDPEHKLWFEIVTGPHAELLESLHIPIGQGAIGHCAEHGVSLNLADILADDSFSNDPILKAGIPVGPCLCAPIQHQQLLKGILFLYKENKQDTPTRPFAEGELSVCAYLASSLAEYLNFAQSAQD